MMFMTTPILLSEQRTLWDQLNSSGLRDSNCIILIGGIKFGDLVLSIVEIQCPFLGVSECRKRDSTV